MDFITFVLCYYGLSFINIFLFDDSSDVTTEVNTELNEIKYQLNSITRELREVKEKLNTLTSS